MNPTEDSRVPAPPPQSYNILLLPPSDAVVRVKLWLASIWQSRGVNYVMENSARVLVNRGRLFKYLAMVVFGFVCLGMLVAVKESGTQPNVIVTDSVIINTKWSIRQVNSVESLRLKPWKRNSTYIQEQLQKERRKSVATVCKRALRNVNFLKDVPNAENIDPDAFQNIYVNDKHKVLYCEVPKVACTNFKRIMLILSGKVNTTNPVDLPPTLVHGDYQRNYLRTLDTYSPREIVKKITTYFKFMFVRDPLERILSAYRNKFTRTYNEYFKLRYGRKIVSRYRDNPSDISLENGHDVRFTEFIEYLLDPVTSQEDELNPHWRQFYRLCHPCQVKYDFIGKYDTLDEDVDKLLNILNLEDVIRFPKAKPGVPTSDIMRMYFKNVTSQELHKLWKLYAVDYNMFGYKYPNFL